jgi:hypothetical protein
LRDIIQSSLEEALELGNITQFEFNRQIALLGVTSGSALAEMAEDINKKYIGRLQELNDDNREKVVSFFRENNISFAEALRDSSFSDLAEFVPAFAQEVAKAQIAGFDGLEKSQQDTIMRGILMDPAAFLDGMRNATEETQKFYGQTLPALQGGLDLIATNTEGSFLAGAAAIRNID